MVLSSSGYAFSVQLQPVKGASPLMSAPEVLAHAARAESSSMRREWIVAVAEAEVVSSRNMSALAAKGLKAVCFSPWKRPFLVTATSQKPSASHERTRYSLESATALEAVKLTLRLSLVLAGSSACPEVLTSERAKPCAKVASRTKR